MDKITAALEAVDMLYKQLDSYYPSPGMLDVCGAIRAALTGPDQPAPLDAEVREAIERAKTRTRLSVLTMPEEEVPLQLADIALLERRIEGLTEERKRLKAACTVVNIVRCKKCGHYATGGDFNVPTGGDDYYGQCPICHAGDDELQDIDTEADVLDAFSAERELHEQTKAELALHKAAMSILSDWMGSPNGKAAEDALVEARKARKGE